MKGEERSQLSCLDPMDEEEVSAALRKKRGSQGCDADTLLHGFPYYLPDLRLSIAIEVRYGRSQGSSMAGVGGNT